MSSHRHTFEYSDRADLIRQLDATLQKLVQQQFEPYDKARARYPKFTAPAFCNRLKRFERKGGLFPKVMGSKGRRILKLCITPALHAWLTK